MMGGGRLRLVLSLSLLHSVLCSVMPSSCASDVPPEIDQQSSALLQVSKHTKTAVSPHAHSGKEETTDYKANAAATENEETNNADEADAVHASAPNNAAKGIKDQEESNNADEANVVAKEETNNADEADAVHASAPKNAAKGIKDDEEEDSNDANEANAVSKEETNNADEANSGATEIMETSNTDEANAVHASAPNNAAKGIKDQEESNNADEANVVAKEETNNADEADAVHASAPENAAKGIKDDEEESNNADEANASAKEETNNADEANSGATEIMETSNTDEANAADASAPENAKSSTKDKQEINNADEANAAAEEEEQTNNADEANAAAMQKEETNNADEANAADASDLENVANSTEGKVETKNARKASAAVEKKETNSTDEVNAPAPVPDSFLKISQASSSNTSAQPRPLPAQKGQARAILEPSLFNVGIQLLGSEDTLDVVVANTAFQDVLYSGEKLHMRLVLGEGGDDPVPGQPLYSFGSDSDDDYGLNSLGSLEPNALGMLEMLDIGANVGAASVAAFKKQSNRLRIVAVEPNPSTYFLFLWNLFLNGVPQLSEQTFHDNPKQAGVLAINKGVASTDDQVVGLCYTPPHTMMARICDCSVKEGKGAFQPGIEQCANVVSGTFSSFLGNFLNGRSHLGFLKLDCEGCENDLLPALAKYAALPSWKLGRLAGELHRSVENAVEEVTCQYDGGQWLVHICATKEKGRFVAPVAERCRMGASRESCTYGVAP